MVDRKESAADVKISIAGENNVAVVRLTHTKDIDIEEIGGSGRVLPDGYSINSIRYQGTMELAGNKLDLEEQLFDDNGIPVENTITVTHFDDTPTTYTPVLATSSGWEMNEGESTTTTFEFVAFGRHRNGQVDTNPA